MPFKKRRRKLYLLVAIVAMLTFAIGMTSIGEVPLVTEIKNQILGTSKMVKTNSAREGDETVVESAGSEAEAYKEIENAFDVEIVRIGYMPEDIHFFDYEVDVTLKKASLLYQYENNMLEYRISFAPTEQATGYYVDDKLMDEQILMVAEVPIDLKGYEVADSKETLYVAQFEYKDTYYTLNATTDMEEGEIIEILKNLYFF